MYEVRIPDHVYQQVSQAARDQHVSLEEFVTEALQLHLQDDAEDYNHLFTPEVIAQLDAAAADVRAGKSFTGKEVDEFLAENRKEWLEKHAS